MKLLVAFVFLAAAAMSVQSSPLDRIASDVSIHDIKDDIDIEKILEVLAKIEAQIPDDFQWRVKAIKSRTSFLHANECQKCVSDEKCDFSANILRRWLQGEVFFKAQR